MATEKKIVKAEEIAAITTATPDFNIPEGYICTLDMTTNESKVKVATALNGSEPLKNYVNKVIELVGIVTTPGTRSVSGNDCTNNYLILADGKVLFSQSDGVARSLKVITALWGAELQAGEVVKVKCIEQTLNNGNTLKSVVPAV